MCRSRYWLRYDKKYAANSNRWTPLCTNFNVAFYCFSGEELLVCKAQGATLQGAGVKERLLTLVATSLVPGTEDVTHQVNAIGGSLGN
jgi:hypothetical protein